ncbi:MAG: TraX family protein [Lachnospiraceae bacterium]|nr:TraX family protein [Lachnospiraceae bacterium]
MIEMGEKKLNRDIIKYAAVFAMLLNHMAHVFLQEGSLEYEICVAVGYFTAVTMCYFLVEGYQYTRSKKKYGQRLLLFAIISQVPYQAALGIRQLNMLFTLLFCFLILVCLEYIQDSAERSVCVCLLAAATCICDWGGLAAAFTVLFAQAYGSRRKLLYAYGLDYLLFSLVSAAEYAKTLSWALAVPRGLLEGVGILASGVVIIFFYSGKRTGTGGRFSKWFFYVFYPMHLFALWVINSSYF